MTSQTPRPLQPVAPAKHEPGDLVLGRYRLEAPIGFGGMGTVWRAHNESLGSSLALKLIRDTGAWPASSSERLLVEAKTTASLRHPAIVRVFDFGETEHGDSFIAMELLAGESLRDRLDNRGPMQAIDAVRTLLPILGGLGCAHARGIIHRDLKPDNIFLARDDADGIQPKVLDFGIAMLEGAVSRMTTAGVLLGSPSYMSPEQALGQDDLDLRVDVWSLAVVLYEAIAGRTPWHARSCPVLLRAIVDDPPAGLIGIGGVDAELWSILSKGLAKCRDERWPSAKAFGAALAGWLIGVGASDDICGASLRSVWLGHQSGDVRPSLRSIPPSCSTPVVHGTTSRVANDGPARSGRMGRWQVGAMAAVAASLLVWGGRVRTSAAVAPESGSTIVSAAAETAPARFDGQPVDATIAEEGKVADAAERTPVAPVTHKADALSAGRASRVRRAARPATSAAPTALATPTHAVAREMDFGF